MVTVLFNLRSSVNEILDQSPRLRLTPLVFPLVYSGSIVVGDPVEYDIDANGEVTASNVVPNSYSCSVWTTKIETEFALVVPEQTGSVNAATLIS